MTKKSKISAVLPLNINEMDKSNSCEITDILFSSLRKFSSPSLFDKFFLICPRDQVPTLSQYSSSWPELPLEIIDEERLVPEFTNFPTVGGWRKQQIIKLAIASLVKTPFYLTFDADVICTSPITEEILLPNNKALLQVHGREFRAWWWNSSAKYLNTNPNIKKPGMSVTPAILSTQVCLDLIQSLDNTKNGWVHNLLQPHKKFVWQRMLPWFKNRFSWTEYSLYYLFLEKNNNIDFYHSICDSEETTLRLLSNQNSVWNSTPFEEWDPAKVFSSNDKALFCVIQSNKNIPSDIVWDRVKKYIT